MFPACRNIFYSVQSTYLLQNGYADNKSNIIALTSGFQSKGQTRVTYQLILRIEISIYMSRLIQCFIHICQCFSIDFPG